MNEKEIYFLSWYWSSDLLEENKLFRYELEGDIEEEEEEDIFVLGQLYNMESTISLSWGLARPRDVVGALMRSTFSDYTHAM